MKIKIRLIFLTLFVSAVICKFAAAGSFYNSRGLGEIKYFANAQAIGMGGSLIAVPDYFQINVLNPAGLAFIPLTRLSGDFLHEAIWNKTKSDNGFVKYTNLNGISFAVPLKTERLVASISLIPSSQFDYEYYATDSINNYGYTKKIKAAGGLNKMSVGFGLALTKSIYLGNYLHVNFGKLEQSWIVDYTSDLFWDSNNQLARKMWGLNWTGGLIFRPIQNLYLGMIYSTNYRLSFKDQTSNFTQNGNLIYVVDTYETESKKLTIPEFWGWGVTYVFKEKYRFSSDVIYQPWSKFKSKNNLLTDYNDSYRIGFGIERLPSKNMLAKYYEKMIYRAGYFFNQLDFKDQSGNNVSEYGISLGAGLPYYGNWGRIDIALRYGQRGNLSLNPVSEDLFQIYISVTGGEKWFLRGK